MLPLLRSITVPRDVMRVSKGRTVASADSKSSPLTDSTCTRTVLLLEYIDKSLSTCNRFLSRSLSSHVYSLIYLYAVSRQTSLVVTFTEFSLF